LVKWDSDMPKLLFFGQTNHQSPITNDSVIMNNTGKVILAGAGPGDPELISLKLLKHLQQAEVILTDRLVSPEIIEQHANPQAQVVYVGKACSKGIHTPQESINQLILKYAQEGKYVLRLKGGDAMLFSNILDELQILKAHQIPYEIVPGISAAFGAAAYTGIPLTARAHSRGVRLLTLFDLEGVSPEEWQDWAQTQDTLVFYMSGQKLQILCQQLLDKGIDTQKSLAVIQQASTPYQKTQVFNFEALKTTALPKFEYVPTLMMIGNVVNLHQEFTWLQENPQNLSYFDQHKNMQ
jgi:uroporphyrin-III C-methyltransferase